MTNMMAKLLSMIGAIQYHLDFKSWDGHPQFASVKGLGRIAVISCALSSIFTFHALVLLLFCIDRSSTDLVSISLFQGMSDARSFLFCQGLVYILFLCTFHMGEFFVTALWNPSQLTASSYMVNHSKAYTIAMLVSSVEFWIRFLIFPNVNNKKVAMAGLVITLIGQGVRSLAMITCGESFNHIIQQTKKDSHVLITHGIYKYLRHPSYFGFYYWSVGSQLLLGNFITSIAFALASWSFFNKRIPFEEKTLLEHFPNDYLNYVKSSHIGIPFIKSGVHHHQLNGSSSNGGDKTKNGE